MSLYYGNNVAKDVRNGVVDVGPGAWVPVTSSLPQGGSGTQTILPGRQWIQLQARGPGAIALAYTSKTRHASFETTVPAYSAHSAKIIPANTIWQEPLSDTVQLWARFIAKSGSTAGGMKLVVTEYS